MAREILAALDGRFDEFVMGVGTGGCFSGNAEVYKQQVPEVRCVAVEPAKSRALSGQGPLGGHRLEGMGAGFVPSICRLDLADEIVAVTDEDALGHGAPAGARGGDLRRHHLRGERLGGPASGRRRLGPGHRVVTVICDCGLKYLQGELYRG